MGALFWLLGFGSSPEGKEDLERQRHGENHLQAALEHQMCPELKRLASCHSLKELALILIDMA